MREPWQVNVLAEEAALAAIADREHGRRTLEFVAAERDWLFRQSRGASTAYIRSRRMPTTCSCAWTTPHAQLIAHLLENKILIRDCTGSPGIRGEAVRIAVRTRAENERLIASWKEFSCVA